MQVIEKTDKKFESVEIEEKSKYPSAEEVEKKLKSDDAETKRRASKSFMKKKRFGFLFRSKKKKPVADFTVDEGVSIEKLSLNAEEFFEKRFNIIEEYPVSSNNARVKIVSVEKLGEGLHYFVDENPLNEREYNAFRTILGIISNEIEPPTDENENPEEYLYEQAVNITKKYRKSVGEFSETSWEKIFYYIMRNLAGYGPLQVLMLDPNIEDISCNGLNSPVFIWHRRYESMPTNITFTMEQITNDFLVKLAHRSSKHISSAQPMLDAMLSDKHRLAATYMKEVSMKGSTFCIRKFLPDPLSIVDLIKIGTLDAKIAAYLWLLLEYKMSFMIVGGTGSGKTSMLNALLSLMSQNDKIVTVEEVPELSPPLANWTQLNSRESFQFGSNPVTSINLFDLVKMSLRYRPDYIIVGEVRGEEAYVLFQALATGHGGLCTMHADSLDSVVKRLTSPPMNVSDTYIPLMNCAILVQRVDLPKKRVGINFGRRVRNLWEIQEFQKYQEIVSWNSHDDSFDTNFKHSHLLRRIAKTNGLDIQTILRELESREKFLLDLMNGGVRDQKEIARRTLSYYAAKKERKYETENLERNDNKQVKKEEVKKRNITPKKKYRCKYCGTKKSKKYGSFDASWKIAQHTRSECPKFPKKNVSKNIEKPKVAEKTITKTKIRFT